MKNKLTHHDAKKVLQWCIEKYGISKINGNRLSIQYRKPDYDEEDMSGYYDKQDETIFVNKLMNENIEDLVKTVIHEYVHYRFHNMKDYYVLSKYMDHDDNPMEKEADKIESRDYKECLLFLKKSGKK
jgi:Zn-dependent peptidase ImmA (M78 family)